MTKDEALAEIDRIRFTYLWQDSRKRIREILDQIDQPQEFTVRELVELLGDATGRWSVSRLTMKEFWELQHSGTKRTYGGIGITGLKAKLLELANPQPPEDKVAVMIDRKLAGLIASGGTSLAEACREALKTPAT